MRRLAEGKLRTPKSKDLRRRNLIDAGLLPTVLPKPSSRPHTAKPLDELAPAPARHGEFRPKKFGAARTGKTDRTSRPADSFASGEANKLFRPARPTLKDSAPPRVELRTWSSSLRRPSPPGGNRRVLLNLAPHGPLDAALTVRLKAPCTRGASGSRPAWKKDDRPARPPARFDRRLQPAKPSLHSQTSLEEAGTLRTPASARLQAPLQRLLAAKLPSAKVFHDEDLGPVRPPNLHIEEITGSERSSYASPRAPRSVARSTDRPSSPRPYSDRPASSRPSRSAHVKADRPTLTDPTRF